jgi:hypothetical protein
MSPKRLDKNKTIVYNSYIVELRITREDEMWTSESGMKHYSVVETAKLIRQELKQRFPNYKFSVKSSSYSGGASISIDWKNGPSYETVKGMTFKYQGASFDAMIDLKSYVDTDYKGETVHFGADYVFCEREYSHEAILDAVEIISKQYGISVPEFKEWPEASTWVIPNTNWYRAEQLLHEMLNKTSFES